MILGTARASAENLTYQRSLTDAARVLQHNMAFLAYSRENERSTRQADDTWQGQSQVAESHQARTSRPRELSSSGGEAQSSSKEWLAK
jgi:hypothetical protein